MYAKAIICASAIATVGLLAGCSSIVQLPPGDITLTETKVLDATSSGLTYRGAADGSTRLTAGVTLQGWTDRGGGVWGVRLPKDSEGRFLYTENLFVNGRRAQRSRYPADGGFFRVASVTQFVTKASIATNRIVVSVKPDDSVCKILASMTPEELGFAQLLAHIKWDVARYPIASYAQGQVAVDAPPVKSLGPADYFALENVRGSFTEPGQWFYDGVAGEILYRPMSGETIGEAIVPREGLETLLHVQGARDVAFENVTFAFTAPTDAHGPTRLAPYQAAAYVSKAAVVLDGATNVCFRNCRVEHTGGYGVWFRAGCVGGGLYDSELTDLGAGGVRIGLSRTYTEPAPWLSSHVSVENCLIAHAGRFHPSGVGVFIAHASDCSVLHNDIFDLFYTGISVGWVWGYAGSPAQRNTIAFNHIRDIGQSKLADMGGIYLLGTSFGTCVSNNLIHGIHSYSYGGWGLYTDEGSEGIVLENNIVYDTHDASFHQHYGRNNILRNNILLDSRAGQIAVTRGEPHRSFTAERNIILWTTGDAFVRCKGTCQETARIDWRSNLWWRVDGKDLFNKTSFAEWCARVKDEGSLFVDPRFADWQKRDFTLPPNSPALKLGFTPFDHTRAGRIR